MNGVVFYALELLPIISSKEQGFSCIKPDYPVPDVFYGPYL